MGCPLSATAQSSVPGRPYGARHAHRPFARLPDEVVLTLTEADLVLSALDRGEELAPVGSSDRRLLRRAVRIISDKLWPKLGELLGQED